MPRKTGRRKAPSVSGLRKFRTEMLSVLRALRDAQARARDVGERARIEGAMLEIGKRAEKLAAVLDRVATMRVRQERYQMLISRLGDRIEKLVGRNYRGAERWLRRWKNL